MGEGNPFKEAEPLMKIVRTRGNRPKVRYYVEVGFIFLKWMNSLGRSIRIDSKPKLN